LYPFDPNRALAVKNGLEYFAARNLTTIDVAKTYLLKAPKLVLLEIIFMIMAFAVYVRTKEKKS
jgi:hypothetical protein